MPLKPYYNDDKHSRYNETKRLSYSEIKRQSNSEIKRKNNSSNYISKLNNFYPDIKYLDGLKRSKTFPLVILVLLLSLSGLCIDYDFPSIARKLFIDRRVSLDFGNGKCEWTQSIKLDAKLHPHGTLFASYPGSGMRLVWQMTEGATGIQVGDDFFYSGKTINGLVKTQYPHPEGIWSYGKAMSQVILLVRNPRWNIPSYHSTLYELEYAHDYNVAYDNVYNLFTRRGNMTMWIMWRDYRIEDEINLWALQIDFWMEGGSQFWENLDFERAGQYPFGYRTQAQRPWPLDEHCANKNDLDCVAKAVISYERLKAPETGPGELRKITDLLRYKKKISVISDETMDCVWNQTWTNAPEKRNENRDSGGPAAEDYTFTMHQMEAMLAKVIFMKNKYSTGDWVLNRPARDLVVIFHSYINEISGEIANMQISPTPTPAPVADLLQYKRDQVAWYNTIGKGNKYAKDIVQHMSAYWPLVEDRYNGTEPQPIPCQTDYNPENLTLIEKEWLNEHNTRRTEFYRRHALPPKDLEWSQDLADSAQTYAERLANDNITGCWLQNRLDGDQYGTQNMAYNEGDTTASPSEVLQAWHDEEILLDTMTLVGYKFHAAMLLFRSTHYMGCGQAWKENERKPGDKCHFHVCRYMGPGNCFLEAFIDVYPNFLKLMPENCMQKWPDNYWVCSAISDYASSICQSPPLLPMYPKDKCQD